MRLLIMSLLVGLSTPAWSGARETYAMWHPGWEATQITVMGRIEGGQDLIAAIEKIRKSSKTVVALELNSYGGSGDTGMILAEYVAHKWRLPVVITNICYSSCALAALVALGKGQLEIGRGAEVGVHQFYYQDTGTSAVEFTQSMARYLQRYGAPKAPLDLLVATPPGDMEILHEDQLKQLGARRIEVGWLWWLFGAAL